MYAALIRSTCSGHVAMYTVPESKIPQICEYKCEYPDIAECVGDCV